MWRIGNEAVMTCNSTIMVYDMIHYWAMYHYVKYETASH